MKTANASIRPGSSHILDIHQPEHAARLGEAFSRERHNVLAALEQLETMHYADAPGRERTALATMEPLPAHGLMARAPREVLKLRAALFLVSCHDHRRN